GRRQTNNTVGGARKLDMRDVNRIPSLKGITPGAYPIGFEEVTADESLSRLGQNDVQLALERRVSKTEYRGRNQSRHDATSTGKDEMSTRGLARHEMIALIVRVDPIPEFDQLFLVLRLQDAASIEQFSPEVAVKLRKLGRGSFDQLRPENRIGQPLHQRRPCRGLGGGMLNESVSFAEEEYSGAGGDDHHSRVSHVENVLIHERHIKL